ncbi:MAG: TRAP transporter small permease [Blautia sp.]|nr:TRAP transporter small permease [Blautia sp.]
MKTLKWWDKNLELVILAILLAVMSVLSFTNVIMRYVFQNALSWSDEVCCYCLALSAFFALPCAIRMGTTIKVDTFTILLPKGVQKALGILCSVGMVAFLIWLFMGSVAITRNAAAVHQASPALGIPISYLYTLMAIAIILAVFRYLQLIIRTVKGTKEEEEEA